MIYKFVFAGLNSYTYIYVNKKLVYYLLPLPAVLYSSTLYTSAIEHHLIHVCIMYRLRNVLNVHAQVRTNTVHNTTAECAVADT